jgi:integrase
VQPKAGADQFEHRLRTALLAPTHTTKEVPTFAAYADELKKTYVLANNKPSERSMKASIRKRHLLPDARGDEARCDQDALHRNLQGGLARQGAGRKRVNNVPACLGKMLRYARDRADRDRAEGESLEDRAAAIRLSDLRGAFTARRGREGPPATARLVLLGAEAGLRQGEIMALQWGDVDLVAGVLTVMRSSAKGVIGTPKSGRKRKIPLTGRLKVALKTIKHLRSELVLCHPDGSAFTQSAIEAALRFGCKKAGLRVIGSHVLGHTSVRLAGRGAARRGAEGDSGAGRPQHTHDDAQGRAPGAARARDMRAVVHRMKRPDPLRGSSLFAEREGFEPSVRCWQQP